MKSELGQVVVEVCEEVGVMATDLRGVVVLRGCGRLIEHIEELDSALDAGP
jgi:hypothetical protein